HGKDRIPARHSPGIRSLGNEALMIHLRIRTADGTILREAPVAELSTALADQANLIWIDLDDPTEDELGLVGSIVKWTDFTVEDLISRDERAKIESFDGYNVVVMHDLTYNGNPKKLTALEVDFVIGSNYVATVHYHEMQHIIDARDISQHL